MVKACILTIGDEILIGQVINTNAAHLSSQITAIGIQVEAHITCMDEPPQIKEALALAASKADIVLCTGGLGPTEDDKTKLALADYFDDELVFHEPTYARLEKLMMLYNRKVIASQRQQCFLPAKATILTNDIGTAPGMELHKDGVTYYFMPGVPSEMRAILERGILPELKKKSTNKYEAITLSFVGMGESKIEAATKELLRDKGDDVHIAFLPNKSIVRMRLSGYDLAPHWLETLAGRVNKAFSEFIYAQGDRPIHEVVAELLKERGQTIGFAESCTGGAVSALMTSMAGASAYFQGSILSYANELKINLLGVDPDIIVQHGAVSAPCAEAMAVGAREALGTDIAISLTGIAGPTGGSDEKPVGTLFVGISSEQGTRHYRFSAGRHRKHNIDFFTQKALNVLRMHLLQEESV